MTSWVTICIYCELINMCRITIFISIDGYYKNNKIMFPSNE